MNKTELIAKVAEKAELSKKDAGAAVNALFECISEELASGGAVQVIGFGNFEVRTRSAREAKNPQTGESISIPETKVPAFKAGSALKAAVR